MEKSNCGKWILSGEHSVLRGGSVVLFPMYRMQLKVKYTYKEDFHCYFGNSFSPSQTDFFKQAIQQAFSQSGRKERGVFELHSDIPLGSGLGSSAAFCLSISQIFFEQSWVSDVLNFAIELEHFFHGKSSGADVLVSYHQSPLIFKERDAVEKLNILWKPYIYLYNTGRSSLTKKCVHQVNSFIEKFPKEAHLLDHQMSESVHLAVQSLTVETNRRLECLVQSINKAYGCFEKWGLLKNLDSKIKELKTQGALAVKPTGAGGGGFLLSLWERPLSEGLIQQNHLIPVEYS